MNNHRIPVTDHVSAADVADRIQSSMWNWRKWWVVCGVLIVVVAWLTLLLQTNTAAQASSRSFAGLMNGYCETGKQIVIYTYNGWWEGSPVDCGLDYIVLGTRDTNRTFQYSQISSVQETK